MKNFEKQHQEIKETWGQNIADFAQQLINSAKESNQEVTGTFNGIDLVVSPDSDLLAYDLVQYFHQESKKRAEEYRKSPEGIQAAKEAEERRQNMQEKADQLITGLDSLDFSDYEAVLEWICDFQKVSGKIVSFYKSKIISVFKDYGFNIDVNTGSEFNKEDAENFAKYIVGQALDGINKVGAIH